MTASLRSLFGLICFTALSVGAESATPELDLSQQIQPVPEFAKFSDSEFNVWCGSMVRDDSGKCHLFYSRWPKKLGHLAWVSHSEVARAVADHPLGPYKHVEVVLPPRGQEHWDGLCTHNPTVMRFGNKYYLYYMGNTGDGKVVSGLNWSHRNKQRIGVAVADSPSGPWSRSDKPLIDTTPGFHDAQCLANPSVVAKPEGGYLMVYKAIADKGQQPFGGPVVHVVATSDAPTGPFKKHPDPVFTSPGSSFAAEDPFIWRGEDRYWAIVKDFGGNFTKVGTSLALFESRDGIDWKLSKHPLVSKVGIRWEGKEWQVLPKLERPQLWLQNGKPAVLFCAAAERADLNHSFNVAIPLIPVDSLK
ncbi:MAG: sucrase [Verrucomicrobia bacterium]|nr:MAG: sucrase [Verrucomicrobiota bacterium]TAE85488.1 MAG: sucrase [Verrucomicrobiota bacterium]TAF22593.1 MAG: sucrase [Verrucomicrobiota bacterium]